MIRTLLTTTTLVSLVAFGAMAQEATKVAPAQQARTDYFSAAPEQLLASSVLGKTVYTGADEQGEAIGDVNDVVINANGGAEALVIGVGGFLGIGEKDVAINFDRVSLSNRDGQRIIVVTATKEELEAAPEFKRAAIMDGAAATMPEAEADGAATSSADAQAPQPEQPDMGTTPQMTDPEAVDTGTNVAAATPPAELKPVDPALISADKLIGTAVKVADDTTIGEIGDVILGKSGMIEAYIIDVGGFLGIGEKPVAIAAQSVQVMADAGGTMVIYSPFTKEQLERQVAYDKDAYAANPGNVMLVAPVN